MGPPVRITEIETFALSNRRSLVRIATDEGVVGWGDPTLENWVGASLAAVARMADYLIGEDPLQITRHWQVLARGGFYRGGPVLGSALAGIDQALWDIAGRWHGAPVHQLLGGPCRDEIRAYAHANTEGRLGDPATARGLVADGFTLIKVAPEFSHPFLGTPASLERLVSDFAEMRAAVGSGVDLAIDLHGRLSLRESVRLLPMIEHLNPVFVEEPLRPEHSSHIGAVVRATTVPIATGERLYSRDEFRPVLDAGIALAQPDVSHAGGITEVFRIATLAETYDVHLAPHCPLGPVALAASLQIDFAIPNAFAQEQGINATYEQHPDLEIVKNPEVLRPIGGVIARPIGNGLGIDIDEDAVRARALTGPLDPGSPTWRQPDGGFAEW